MSFTLPPDRVVYEEDPEAAAKLLASDRQYRAISISRGDPPAPATTRPAITAAGMIPDCWQSFLKSPLTSPVSAFWGSPAGGRSTSPIIFLHELTIPSGNKRLVAIAYDPEQNTFCPAFIAGYNYHDITLTPATWTQAPVVNFRGYAIDVISGFPRQPPRVRIFAGQPDPADPSHFTIRYQFWEQEDTIDGRIDAAGNVTLTQRKIPGFPR
jgi:hypothetical protein